TPPRCPASPTRTWRCCGRCSCTSPEMSAEPGGGSVISRRERPGPRIRSSRPCTGWATASRGCGWGGPGAPRDLLARRGGGGERGSEAEGTRLAYICAQGCGALMAVARGAFALAGSLVLDAESVVERPLSALHFVAMFPRLAAARLAARRGDWANAVRAAAT